MLRITSFFIILIFVSGCKKNNDPVTIHCDNLINDVLPADDKGRIDVASAFTPNGDGLNDTFRPIASSIQSISVKVYDDDSKLVFNTQELNTGWYIPYQQINKFGKFYYRVEAVTLKGNKIGKCGEVYAFLCMPSNMSINNFSFEDQGTSLGFTGISMESIQSCN